MGWKREYSNRLVREAVEANIDLQQSTWNPNPSSRTPAHNPGSKTPAYSGGLEAPTPGLSAPTPGADGDQPTPGGFRGQYQTPAAYQTPGGFPETPGANFDDDGPRYD